LLYVLEMGAIEQGIARQAIQAGEALPDKIANAPELEDGLEIYFEAFFELDTERNHGMGLTQIPWSKIRMYAEANGYDEDQTEELHAHIRTMDNAHLARLEKKKTVGKPDTKGTGNKAS
jgi:hypothetical protein